MDHAKVTTLASLLLMSPVIYFSEVYQDEYFYNVRMLGIVVASFSIGICHFSQKIPTRSYWHLAFGALAYATLVCAVYLVLLMLAAYLSTFSGAGYKLLNTTSEARFLVPSLAVPLAIAYILSRLCFQNKDAPRAVT